MSSQLSIDERMQLENWRKVNWERLGFTVHEATVLSEFDEIDFHDVEKFLAEHPGCDHETALDIVR